MSNRENRVIHRENIVKHRIGYAFAEPEIIFEKHLKIVFFIGY